MAVRAMRVAVGNLFRRRRLHIDHLQREGDVLARQRVVAVEDDGVALDLHHGEDLAAADCVRKLKFVDKLLEELERFEDSLFES